MEKTVFIMLLSITQILKIYLTAYWRNQDGGVGRHTAPPRTTRTDKIERQGNPAPRK